MGMERPFVDLSVWAGADSDDEAIDGSFADETKQMVSLFADPDARGRRRWKDMFDPSACEEVSAEDILAVCPRLH